MSSIGLQHSLTTDEAELVPALAQGLLLLCEVDVLVAAGADTRHGEAIVFLKIEKCFYAISQYLLIDCFVNLLKVRVN